MRFVNDVYMETAVATNNIMMRKSMAQQYQQYIDKYLITRGRPELQTSTLALFGVAFLGDIVHGSNCNTWFEQSSVYTDCGFGLTTSEADAHQLLELYEFLLRMRFVDLRALEQVIRDKTLYQFISEALDKSGYEDYIHVWQTNNQRWFPRRAN